MLQLTVPLVLASASPRRARLLSQLGLTYEIRPSGDDETWPDGLAPGPAVEVLAERKGRVVAASPSELVLSADTVVVHDGAVLGKPADEAEARDTLRTLSGATHEVFTGLALRHGNRHATAHACTYVTFATLTDAEIDAYVATGSPMDKAGAYGIQDDLGALLVESIEGDFYNVVGLPLRTLYNLLRNDFADLLEPA